MEGCEVSYLAKAKQALNAFNSFNTCPDGAEGGARERVSDPSLEVNVLNVLSMFTKEKSPAKASSEVRSRHVLNELNVLSPPAWDDLDQWRQRIACAQGRPARDGALSAVVADWCRAAGCERVDGFWHLPPGLKDGYALLELKRIATNLGLLAKDSPPTTGAADGAHE